MQITAYQSIQISFKKSIDMIFILLILLSFIHCSSGDYRAEKFSPDSANPGKISPKDKDIEDTFKIRPIAKSPFRLGIFISEKGGFNWQFTEQDKSEVITVCDELKKNGILSSAFFISQNQKNKRSPHELKALGLTLGMSTWMLNN